MLSPIVMAGDLTGVAATATTATPGRSAILFVHGLFGGAWQFASWQRYFAELGYASVAVNLRGHHGSRSVPDIGKVSVRAYVDDALDAARAMERDTGTQPIVVGYSMGGFIAQKLAEAGAVRAAVLLCAAPPRGISTVSVPLLVRQLRYTPALLASRALAPQAADAAVIVFNRVPEANRGALFAAMVPDSGRAARELLLGMFAIDERAVRCPVLSVSAGDDRFLVPRIGRALARKYRAEYREFAGHGHYLIAEPGWPEVAGAIAQWIETAIAQTAPAAAPPR